jgi:hypothetical protein
MNSTVTQLVAATCAVMAIACGGERDPAERDTNPPATVTPAETAGTSGTDDRLITVSGCLTKAEPDGFILTSNDEAIVRQETGTTGHHRDPERMDAQQNPSATMGRYRIEGDAERLVMHVDREVEIEGRVEHRDNANETPASLKVTTIDATGPRCK